MSLGRFDVEKQVKTGLFAGAERPSKNFSLPANITILILSFAILMGTTWNFTCILFAFLSIDSYNYHVCNCSQNMSALRVHFEWAKISTIFCSHTIKHNDNTYTYISKYNTKTIVSIGCQIVTFHADLGLWILLLFFFFSTKVCHRQRMGTMSGLDFHE